VNKTVRRTATLVGLGLVMAACGGSDNTDTPTTSTASTPTTAVTTTTSTTTTTAPEAGDPASEETMLLTSSAFEHEGAIPTVYSCDGADISPPLALQGIPPGAGALALVMEDPDAPVGVWDHWVEYDFPVLEVIEEDVSSLGTEGLNSWGRTGYGGPCPPGGTHRYFFTVYALDATVGLTPGATKDEVLAAISDHVLAEATLMGTYSR
jgi:Raf kinase inhibitor-like YbhB/YbcL family protein